MYGLESSLFLIPLVTVLVSLGWYIFLIIMIMKFDKRDERKLQIMEEYASHNKVLAAKVDDLSKKVTELENRG